MLPIRFYHDVSQAAVRRTDVISARLEEMSSRLESGLVAPRDGRLLRTLERNIACVPGVKARRRIELAPRIREEHADYARALARAARRAAKKLSELREAPESASPALLLRLSVNALAAGRHLARAIQDYIMSTMAESYGPIYRCAFEEVTKRLEARLEQAGEPGSRGDQESVPARGEGTWSPPTEVTWSPPTIDEIRLNRIAGRVVTHHDRVRGFRRLDWLRIGAHASYQIRRELVDSMNLPKGLRSAVVRSEAATARMQELASRIKTGEHVRPEPVKVRKAIERLLACIRTLKVQPRRLLAPRDVSLQATLDAVEVHEARVERLLEKLAQASESDDHDLRRLCVSLLRAGTRSEAAMRRHVLGANSAWDYDLLRLDSLEAVILDLSDRVEEVTPGVERQLDEQSAPRNAISGTRMSGDHPFYGKVEQMIERAAGHWVAVRGFRRYDRASALSSAIFRFQHEMAAFLEAPPATRSLLMRINVMSLRVHEWSFRLRHGEETLAGRAGRVRRTLALNLACIRSVKVQPRSMLAPRGAGEHLSCRKELEKAESAAAAALSRVQAEAESAEAEPSTESYLDALTAAESAVGEMRLYVLGKESVGYLLLLENVVDILDTRMTEKVLEMARRREGPLRPLGCAPPGARLNPEPGVGGGQP